VGEASRYPAGLGPRLSADEARPQTRRWAAQRWLVDNVIQANGIDWDQPRSVYLNVPCGMEASADFATIRAQVKKFADCSPAFEAAAHRRQAKAEAAATAGQLVTARNNYFMAAIHWGAAQWPIEANDARNIAFNDAKRDCYSAYARLADHRVEAAWIPFQGKALPAWFHLPPGYSGGRIPTVVAIPGMDSFKEGLVSLYGDPLLSRGMAVLALDGPGQYESPVLGIPVSMENWVAAGPAVMDWLAARPEVDVARVGVTGRSFGSFFGTILAASEPRFAACAVSATCHEPGFETIFEEASPTFKMRFMYMSGFSDEDAFDEFRETLTWEGHAEKIRAPYLCVAGEADELSPQAHTERLVARLDGPKQLVVYQGSRHSIGGPAAANGPHPQSLIADWMAARLAGAPMASERWYVETGGKVTKTPL
jgi:dienelactone hydrolase